MTPFFTVQLPGESGCAFQPVRSLPLNNETQPFSAVVSNKLELPSSVTRTVSRLPREIVTSSCLTGLPFLIACNLYVPGRSLSSCMPPPLMVSSSPSSDTSTLGSSTSITNVPSPMVKRMTVAATCVTPVASVRVSPHNTSAKRIAPTYHLGRRLARVLIRRDSETGAGSGTTAGCCTWARY